jgi:hypothetical protein
MAIHQFDEGVAVLRLDFELDDNHQAAHKDFLRLDSTA